MADTDGEPEVSSAMPHTGDQPVKDPVPPPVEHKPDDELKGMVHQLQEEVNGLRTLVESVVNDGESEMDKSPVRKPWTHWKPGK